MSGSELDHYIPANLDQVRRRLEAAAYLAHRPPGDVQLIAVSKTFPVEAVIAAAACGQRDFGENRVQEGLDKIARTADLGLTWHLIGHLQTNKARKAAAAFSWIHSIDSLELLKKVAAGAADAGTRPNVLVQVDLAREQTKFGADLPLVEDLIRAAADMPAVRLRGLMTVPPIADDPEEARPWFEQLRNLRDDLVARGVSKDALVDLSMGMSHDCEVAVAEGATLVRVGTAIFGRRPTPGPVS